MSLTPEQITVIVTVLVGLAVALTNYLNSRSTRKEVKDLHKKVDTLTYETMAYTNVVRPRDPASARPTLTDGHNQPPLPPRG